MNILRLIIGITVVFGEFYIFDPWEVHRRVYIFYPQDMNEIILLYLAMSIITGVVGAILVPLLIHKIFLGTRIRNVSTAGIVTFIILSVMAIICGPYGVIYTFNNRLLGNFFMEWEFANFITKIAFPFSFVASGLEFFFGKGYAGTGSIKANFNNTAISGGHYIWFSVQSTFWRIARRDKERRLDV